MKLLTHDKHEFSAREYKCALELTLELATFNLPPKRVEFAANSFLNSCRLSKFPNARVLTPCLGKWY